MRVPRHIAIIPDGNRRWAYDKGMDKSEGYDYGLDPGVQVLRLAKDLGVEELTYYGFTTDNCKRPRIQVEAFSQACVKAIDMIAEEHASLLVVGNTESEMFPKELLPLAKERVQMGEGGIKVNFLVNYGWEWDLSSKPAQSRNRNSILSTLQSKEISRIDLVMRWGGRMRLSGLLPVQSVYADFYAIDDLWPDFTPDQFLNAIKWYNTQDVTLGG